MLIIDICKSLITHLAVTFMPLIGLYSQYVLIKSRKHVGSFSIDICGILILSNIMKIMFWFSKGFAVNLLVQSFVVIVMAFVLLKLCIDVGYRKNNTLTDLTGKVEQGFWRWRSIGPFIVFTLFFVTFVSLFTAVFVHFHFKPYGQVVGMVAIAIESSLGFTQLYSNQKSKSVEGLSLFMIVTWFCGDFFKTLYFIVMLQPTQFVVGGAVQLAVDLMIVVQVMAFSHQYFGLAKTKFSPSLKDQIETEPSEKDDRVQTLDGI